MKTLKTVVVEPVFVEFIPEVLDDNKIYVSKEYNVAVHNCLCGCKARTVTPLGSTEWTLTQEQDKITMSPSISNYQMPCNSHYIITKNKANFV